uniref:RNA helicase n=1 Tax=Anopheles atroparvus TaxID=41427 RepID=A0AAG5D3B8_ANOAO
MLPGEEDNIVIITHYINPHCFWYKSETAYIPHHEQRQFLEEFNEYCNRVFGYGREQSERAWYNQIERPKVGDLVAQHNKELHRWIRCEVEDILVDLSGVVWYQLWAMDEGLPIKSVKEDIRPLPEAYTSHSGHAKRGGLKNILPTETRYDYLQGKNVLKTRATWCQGIVTTLQTILEDALSVCMVAHSNFLLKKEVVHFGEMFIKTHNNKSFNIVDLLSHACSDQFIITSDEEFFKAVFSGKTLNMVRYKNNEGIDNASSSKIRFLKESTVEKHDYSMRNTHNVRDESSVQDKIGDWFSRNMKAIAEDQKITDEGKKMSPLINATVELTPENNLPLVQHAVTQKMEEKNKSIDAPNDLHPSSSVQGE